MDPFVLIFHLISYLSHLIEPFVLIFYRWTATVSHRPVSGILRVTVPPRLTTIKVDRITVQVSGLTNGERDGKYDSLSDLNSPFLAGNRKLKNRKRERSGRCEMEMTVNETVVVWKPADLDQFEEGLVSGM